VACLFLRAHFCLAAGSFLSCSWFKVPILFSYNRFYFRFLRQVHAPARLIPVVRKSVFLPCSAPRLCTKCVEISYYSRCVLQRLSGCRQVPPARVAAKLGPPVLSSPGQLAPQSHRISLPHQDFFCRCCFRIHSCARMPEDFGCARFNLLFTARLRQCWFFIRTQAC
jgi:hypothetical protein